MYGQSPWSHQTSHSWWPWRGPCRPSGWRPRAPSVTAAHEYNMYNNYMIHTRLGFKVTLVDIWRKVVQLNCRKNLVSASKEKLRHSATTVELSCSWESLLSLFQVPSFEDSPIDRCHPSWESFKDSLHHRNKPFDNFFIVCNVKVSVLTLLSRHPLVAR